VFITKGNEITLVHTKGNEIIHVHTVTCVMLYFALETNFGKCCPAECFKEGGHSKPVK
jgi:hypothetical protein